MSLFYRIIGLFTALGITVLLVQGASAQFWDSWTNTYSPTWTPLSLDQMTSSTDSSWKINTYQPSTSTITTTTTQTPPPADLLIPEGGKGIRISKNGVLRYLDTDALLPFGTKADFTTKEITFLKDYITFLVGTITHYNVGADSFGYVHPSRLEINTLTYRAVSDGVQAPANFTVPEGAVGVRIKEWEDDVQYLNNNMRVSGAKGDYATAKITGSIFNEGAVLGEVTVNNYKKYDNVDSFGYIYPEKLWYAFSHGKGDNSLPLPPSDFVVPEGMLGVRVGDWGNVYYLKDNSLVSPTAFGKLKDYTYDAVTQTMISATKFNIVDFDAEGKEKEIGAITHYIQDADIYSYGYVFTPAENASPATDTPLFIDVPANAPYLEALQYGLQNGWFAKGEKFKPKAKVTRCSLDKLLTRASGKKYGPRKTGCKKFVRRSVLAKTLKGITGFDWPELNVQPKKYATKADVIAALYRAFGPGE